MDKKVFFEKYAINEEEYDKLGLPWADLTEIYAEYCGRRQIYEDTARYLAEIMNREKYIHSIKYRIKDGEHLIEKIIRKSMKDPVFLASYKDYKRTVKDLIGMRALHLFKEHWLDVHRFLENNWDFYTTPRANYKKGDPEDLLRMYEAAGCELNEHKHGYRSIHYHLLVKPGRHEMVAEVQVRTLFEEAWSEIDHYVRYKTNKDSDQAEPYLGILNNITSNADALASYINEMDSHGRAGKRGAREAPADGHMSVREIYNRVRN